jgi:hypothetical protein
VHGAEAVSERSPIPLRCRQLSMPVAEPEWLLGGLRLQASTFRNHMRCVCHCCLQNRTNGRPELASIYDLVTKTYTPFHFTEAAYCGAAVFRQDGALIIIGGGIDYINPPFTTDGRW